MPKFRRKRGGGGGGSGAGTGGLNRSAVVGLVSQVIGGAFMLFALILFGIALNQLDTAYTSASTYDQVGLTDIMGIWGMIVFLLFVGAGITVVAGGAVYSFIKTIQGGFMAAFMSFAMGSVSLVIAFILNTILQAQLNTAQVTINATTNVSNFAGLYDISRIFGMLIFLTLVGSGASAIVASAWGSVKTLKGGF